MLESGWGEDGQVVPILLGSLGSIYRMDEMAAVSGGAGRGAILPLHRPDDRLHLAALENPDDGGAGRRLVEAAERRQVERLGLHARAGLHAFEPENLESVVAQEIVIERRVEAPEAVVEAVQRGAVDDQAALAHCLAGVLEGLADIEA